MGYSLTPYAVDLAKIEALIGSGNERRLKQLGKKLGKGAEQNDGYGITWAEALRHLILGEPYDKKSGPKYGSMIEFFCMQFGEELLSYDNFCDVRGALGWFRELDEQLEEAGVSTKLLSISRLAERGSPIPIPSYNDFPGIGYLTAKEVGPALDALLAAKFDDIGDEADEDGELWLPEEFEEIRGWLETCVESKRDLVCFYS